MNGNLLRQRWSFSLALLAAFIGHLVILKGFVFVCQPPISHPRPSFIFLGSILPKQEVANPSRRHPSAGAQLELKEINLSSDEPDRSPWPMGRNLKKPGYARDLRPAAKTPYKTLEDPEFSKVKSSADSQDLGIDLDVPAYRPLRLYNAP